MFRRLLRWTLGRAHVILQLSDLLVQLCDVLFDDECEFLWIETQAKGKCKKNEPEKIPSLILQKSGSTYANLHRFVVKYCFPFSDYNAKWHRGRLDWAHYI